MIRFLLFLIGISVLCKELVIAQNIDIGQWQEHYACKNAFDVCLVNNKIFCSTKNGIFTYNTIDNSLEKLSKNKTLSESEENIIAYNNQEKTLVIGYQNGSIDLIKEKMNVTIADIKKENISGIKSINHIYNYNEYAYLSCGFGIVVLNIKKQEIKDTYFIGEKGEALYINQIEIFNNKIYAATQKGLYQADLSNNNLNSFYNWNKLENIKYKDNNFTSITSFNNQLYYTVQYDSLNIKKSKLMRLNPHNLQDELYSENVKKTTYNKTNNTLIEIFEDRFEERDSENRLIFKSGLYEGWQIPSISNITCDEKQNYWIADYKNGLIKMLKNSDIERINPNAPTFNTIYNFSIYEDDIFTCSGAVSSSWENMWNHDGLNYYNERKWKTIESENNIALDTIWDIIEININPNKKNEAYASTYGWGLIEVINGKINQVFDNKNSSLSFAKNTNKIKITSSCFDQEGNLWVANSENSNILSVKLKNNQWKSLHIDKAENMINGKLIITRNNQKWLILPKGNGILVYDDNKTIEDETDDKSIVLEFESEKGNIPGSEVFCITEDQDGYIWIGTDQGIAVIYNSYSIFNDISNAAQQIKVVKEGNVQLLLETESINYIKVDGANRKWISTKNGGVFLVSADGTEQVLAFNILNSPLPGNNVGHMDINEKNGEVFFATEKGLLSYRSDATKAQENYSKIIAFPNPVREDYNGLIAINGLMENSEIKITDINGKLIYSTTSLGGQATWNGRDFAGNKAKTGIYLVYASDKIGENAIVTKIAVIE